MKIAISYSIFALIATIANIGSQDISLRIYEGIYAISLSVIVGTVVGLIVKYLLDKKFIFQFSTINITHDTQIFSLYTIMGLITTAIFWFFEFGFDYLFESKEMRYAGGVIGLVIGYFIKYQLDKRFVFVSREA